MQTLFLALAAPLLVATMAACADGGQSNGPTLEVITPTVSTSPGDPTETPAPGATPTAPAPTIEAPTATSTPGVDGAIVVACGDSLAPLGKLHRLEADCVPADLVDIPTELVRGGVGPTLAAEALAALQQMIDAATSEGHTVRVRSAYRSYNGQVAAFEYNVGIYGSIEEAKRFSALPGHSEHQLGTTADLTSAAVAWDLDPAFGSTPEGQWIAANSWKYGFILSYPDGSEGVTGYAYEPWHVRFVGVDVAAEVIASGLTLNQFLLR